MAAPREMMSLYRNILRELRLAYPNGKYKEAPAYRYVKKQFRDNKRTSEQLCRSPIEMAHYARTYLCYMQSVEKHRELHDHYKGGGERTVESTANLVGLGLPKTNH
ncbi:protein FMC1 homolog [Mya arenaria]|uniref:protein FMC1 homolog n=1 Tax=Mya arenaria TaxID=6604 RepID=UPI0022E4C607|nr:protein FMC1 homolog [Mya arenaria]